MDRRIIILVLVVAVIFTACTETPKSKGRSIPGTPPRNITVKLTSQVKYEPFSPEELATPSVQSMIVQCEQLGWKHCREKTVPLNSRTKFVRTQDDKFWIFVYLSGLEEDRDYAIRFRLFDPDRNMRSQASGTIHTNPILPTNFTSIINFSWAPPFPASWQLGQWRAEIAVNGQVMVERTFIVVDQKRIVKSRDDCYVKYDNGVIHDTKTDLEWYVGPDTDITWNKAKKWVDSLSIDGGGWRMPSKPELWALYQKGKGTRNISTFFDTTGWWVWASTGLEAKAKPGFSFDYGSESWEYSSMSSTSRVFAVRNRW